MVLACPVCSVPVRQGELRCNECLVQLDWAGGLRAKHPYIRPGDPLLFFDLTRMPLPGETVRSRALSDGTRFDPAPTGSLLQLAPKRAIELADSNLRSRDACVRAAFTIVDPHLTFSVIARIEKFGAVKMKYSLQVDCTTRKVRLARGFSGPSAALFTDLVPFRPCPVIHPVGTMNIIELRVQGPTLEARINDQHVATMHDPVLGIGAFGMRAETKTEAMAPQRVLVTWFEVRQVIA